jgi:hypothetical protein
MGIASLRGVGANNPAAPSFSGEAKRRPENLPTRRPWPEPSPARDTRVKPEYDGIYRSDCDACALKASNGSSATRNQSCSFFQYGRKESHSVLKFGFFAAWSA